jgi:hypothetical protein
MSRVWQKFFIKVGKGSAFIIGISIWICGVFLSLLHFGLSEDVVRVAGPIISLVIPSLIFVLVSTYRDCKKEVEYENKTLMREIKG